jgi:hypothetical protein
MLRLDDIGYRAVEGVGSSNANDLAIWFRDKHDYWSAALLWKALANTTAAAASKSQYTRSSLSALAHIPAGTQPGKLDLEIQMKQLMVYVSDRQDERDRATGWLVELAGDPAKLQELGLRGRGTILNNQGLAFIGFTDTKFCVKRTSNQVCRGAQMLITARGCWFEHAQSQSGFMKWIFFDVAFETAAYFGQCYTCPQEMHGFALATLGEGGVELIKWHDA